MFARLLPCGSTGGRGAAANQFVGARLLECLLFADAAKACMKTMNGRWFGGKQITAELYDSALFEDEDYSG